MPVTAKLLSPSVPSSPGFDPRRRRSASVIASWCLECPIIITVVAIPGISGVILLIAPSTSMMVGMPTTPTSPEICLNLLTKDYNFDHKLTILTQSPSGVAKVEIIMTECEQWSDVLSLVNEIMASNLVVGLHEHSFLYSVIKSEKGARLGAQARRGEAIAPQHPPGEAPSMRRAKVSAFCQVTGIKKHTCLFFILFNAISHIFNVFNYY